MGLTHKEIVTCLQIGVGTTQRLYEKYMLTGDVAPQKQPEHPDSRKLHELYIIGLICENPAIYLPEICAEILE